MLIDLGIAIRDVFFSLASAFFCYCSSIHRIATHSHRLLDFYGNYFDPRIRRCCLIYFSLILSLSSLGISVRTRQYFFRSQDAHLLLPFSPQPHRFAPLHRQFSIQNTKKQQFQSGKFDPIWVEDPLNRATMWEEMLSEYFRSNVHFLMLIEPWWLRWSGTTPCMNLVMMGSIRCLSAYFKTKMFSYQLTILSTDDSERGTKSLLLESFNFYYQMTYYRVHAFHKVIRIVSKAHSFRLMTS